MNGEKNENGKLLKNDALARLLGIQINEMRPGFARATMEVRPELLNGLGVTHGGAIFSLADIAFAAAGNAYEAGPPVMALSVNITYIKPTTAGDVLTAIAKEEHLNERGGLYRMEVTNSEGELIAVAQGLGYRKNSF